MNEREREKVFLLSHTFCVVKIRKIFENGCPSRARFLMVKQNEITNDVGLDALARRVGLRCVRAVGLSISST
jgi:hypothetical protein